MEISAHHDRHQDYTDYDQQPARTRNGCHTFLRRRQKCPPPFSYQPRQNNGGHNSNSGSDPG